MAIIDQQLINELGRKPKWLAFVQDPQLQDQLRVIAELDRIPKASVQRGNLANAKAFLERGVVPELLLIDITDQQKSLIGLQDFLANFKEDTKIIALGSENNVNFYRELQRLGIQDYLVLPVSEKALREVFYSAKPGSKDSLVKAQQKKPVIVVMGSRGGVGATSLSVNSAWLLSEQFNQRVCLVDLDVYCGDIATFLNLEQNRGINEAFAGVDRLDETYLKRLLIHKEDTFSVLTGEFGIGQKEVNVPVAAVQHLTTILRDLFDVVCIDLSAPVNRNIANAVLGIADTIILVTDLSLASIRDTIQAVSWIKQQVISPRIKVICNFSRYTNNVAVCQASLESALGKGVDLQLPYCKSGMVEAINAGQPFAKMQRSHALTQRLENFIGEVAFASQAQAPAKAESSFWKKFLGSEK